MRSRTKIPLDTAHVAALALANLDSDVAGVSELGEGMYNMAYRVTLVDGRVVVLKVAPPDDVPALRYERGLMRTESDYYRRTLGVAPVPRVLAMDTTRKIVDRDVMFMSLHDGSSLRSRGRRLSRADRRGIRRELGAIVGRVHGIRGERFGYERPDGSLASPVWRDAFLQMTDAVLDDVRHYGVGLGVDAEAARRVIRHASAALQCVDEPVLVHFDLWDGNIFVAREGESTRVTGIIDGERAFWGDPLAEFVSTSLFRDPAADVDFNHAYASAVGAEVSFDENARTRLALYSAYLCLIMLAEAAPRGYRGVGAAATAAFVRRRLKRDLTQLSF